jgi:hypothetical protein
VCLWRAKVPGVDGKDEGGEEEEEEGGVEWQYVEDNGGHEAIPADREEENKVFHVVFPLFFCSGLKDSR